MVPNLDLRKKDIREETEMTSSPLTTFSRHPHLQQRTFDEVTPLDTHKAVSMSPKDSSIENDNPATPILPLFKRQKTAISEKDQGLETASIDNEANVGAGFLPSSPHVNSLLSDQSRTRNVGAQTQTEKGMMKYNSQPMER